MGSLNITSVVKHFDELQVLMEKQPLDIFSINETRLDKSMPDSQINLSRYNLVRRDRNRNGGVPLTSKGD